MACDFVTYSLLNYSKLEYAFFNLGYASAYLMANRSLREELRLSEAELQEERIKSQLSMTLTKGKNTERNGMSYMTFWLAC